MPTMDPYEVLGVPRNASDADVKKAYRRMARKNHPDVNPGDPAAHKKFQEIAAAYEILKDPERRARYDRFGDLGDARGEAPPPGAPPPYGGSRPGAGFRWSGDLGDLFSDIFSGGGGFAGSPFPEEEDAAAALTVSFRDAVLGGTVTFSTRIPRRCSRCRGTGRSGKSACPACHGAGSVVESETLSVRIPAGVDTGSKIRLPGKGRTEGGDLYLSITVEPHPYFGRQGDDILAEVPVTVSEAYLGAEVDVPTIRGPVRARIPEGTQAGQRFRLKGRGIENARLGTTGDHYYRVRVVMPETVAPEGRELAEAFAGLYRQNPRAKLPTRL